MEWLEAPIQRPIRKTALTGLIAWIACFIVLVACMKHARNEGAGVVAVLHDPQAVYAFQQTTPSPTVTNTPTLTATYTLSPTPTVTITVTLSPTVTASQTATQELVASATETTSPTSQPTEAATATPDLIGTLLDMPTELAASTTAGAGAVLTETATLIPFPNITIEALRATSTDALYYLQAPPGESGLPKGSASIWVKLGRYWPLVVILLFWLDLAVWFLVVRTLDRN
jgi:hypothetical protein